MRRTSNQENPSARPYRSVSESPSDQPLPASVDSEKRRVRGTEGSAMMPSRASVEGRTPTKLFREDESSSARSRCDSQQHDGSQPSGSSLDDSAEDTKLSHEHQHSSVAKAAPPLSGALLLAEAAHSMATSQAESLPQVSPPSAPSEPPKHPLSPTSVGLGSYGPSLKQDRKRGVPHVYHDYAGVPDMIGYARKKTGGVTQPFPEKLHELLTNETECMSIVGWLPHGRAFIVRKPKEFTELVMPKYFRQTKLTSFQRQLNLYGFRRITQGADAGAYYHELFLRGRPQLCMRMVRQKIKGTGHKQPADAQTEPNFYAMPPQPREEASSSVAAAAQPAWQSPTVGDSGNPSSSLPVSPGLQGLHGAANLLKGIAAGLPASRLSTTPFLGAPATSIQSGRATTTASSSSSTKTAAAPAPPPSSSCVIYSSPPENPPSPTADPASNTYYAGRTTSTLETAPATQHSGSFIWPHTENTNNDDRSGDDSKQEPRSRSFLSEQQNSNAQQV